MKKRSLIPLLLFFGALTLYGQTAAELDAMLETQTVTAAAAARFVLGAAQLLPPELSGPAARTAAYEMARSRGWVTKDSGQALNLRDTAFLVMNAFDFSGGIMYSLLANPRYAYREMIYRKIIQGRSDPAMPVSGQRLLQIIGRALDYSGENEELDAEIARGGGVM